MVIGPVMGPRFSQKRDMYCFAADLKLTEAVKKSLLPNIEVKTRAKIPRGPRINWLNRCIALYLKFIGGDFLGLKTSAGLLQVDFCCTM